MAAASSKAPPVELEVGDRTVRLSSPDRVYFSEQGETKLDLASYYLSVGPGIVNALRERPCMLHRFPKGVDGPKVHQKRLPAGARPGSRRSASTSPATACMPTSSASPSSPASSGRSRCRRSSSTRGTPAEQTRRSPTSGASTSIPCSTAPSTRCAGPPGRPTRSSTSSAPSAGPRPRGLGSARLRPHPPRLGLPGRPPRRARLRREVERRLPDDVTTTWWRRDRAPSDLFVDYNQNARDHTIAAAYSVRGNPRGTVSPDHVGRGRRRRAAGPHHRDDAGPFRRAR